MLTGIHILLTYKCLFECDHCFVYSSPHSEGTFTYKQICNVLDESLKIGTIKWIYFEGGEPFLYFPLLLEGIKTALLRGFKVGVVTNGYFATTEKDAERWLIPLSELKVSDLSISNDLFHNKIPNDSFAKNAYNAARKLGLNTSIIAIDEPFVKRKNYVPKKGEPVVGGGVMFKGRAVEKLANDLPRVHWENFTECTHEDLVNPERVHVDAYGNVHICQGISIGNMWKTPLSNLIRNYNAESHPICNLIVKGGPVKLTEVYNVGHDDSYIDSCHLCYETRKKLIGKFPTHLAPKQVYGLAR